MTHYYISALEGPAQLKIGRHKFDANAFEGEWPAEKRFIFKASPFGDRPRILLRSDVFNPKLYDDDARAKLWAAIEGAPNIDWLILTSRPQDISSMVPEDWMKGRVIEGQAGRLRAWPDNAWIGASAKTQKQLEKAAAAFSRIPACVFFLSFEDVQESLNLHYPEALYPNGPETCCSGHECDCHGRPIEPPLCVRISWAFMDLPPHENDPKDTKERYCRLHGDLSDLNIRPLRLDAIDDTLSVITQSLRTGKLEIIW